MVGKDLAGGEIGWRDDLVEEEGVRLGKKVNSAWWEDNHWAPTIRTESSKPFFQATVVLVMLINYFCNKVK